MSLKRRSQQQIQYTKITSVTQNSNTQTKRQKLDDNNIENLQTSAASANISSASNQRQMRQIKRVSSPTPKKRLSIKPFKVAPTLPSDFISSTLAKLSDALIAIYNSHSITFSQEELYRSVETLVQNKQSQEIYERLFNECRQHIQRQIDDLQHQTDALISRINSERDTAIEYLKLIELTWSKHCFQMTAVRSIFLYLDRTYVINLPTAQQPSPNTTLITIRSLWDVGLYLFVTSLRKHDKLIPLIRTGLLELVQTERSGSKIDRLLFKSLTRLLINCKLYKTEFEPQLIEQTTRWLNDQSAQRLNSSRQQNSIVDYLHFIARVLKEEEERVSAYLDHSSLAVLIATVENSLITQHLDAMISIGFDQLMNNQAVDDLKILYTLFDRTLFVNKLNEAFANFLKETGLQILSSADSKDCQTAKRPVSEESIVRELLAFKTKLDKIVKTSFENNLIFIDSIKQQFEFLVNSRESAVAEMIAKYVNRILTVNNKLGMSSAEVDTEFQRILFLFRYIHSKDIFSAFYKRDLSKRLLLGKSASTDMEKQMISLIKMECGASYTTELEQMFEDMELSKNIESEFHKHSAEQNQSVNVDYGFKVLTSSLWTSCLNIPPLDLKLPREIVQSEEEFKQFYLQKHAGRSVNFQNALSSAVIRANFPKGRKELVVSAAQAAVFMCFNNLEDPSQILTYQQIQEQTNITDDKELKYTLGSLCFIKDAGILIRTPKQAQKSVNESDSFALDLNFKSPLFRIKLNVQQLKDTKEDETKVTSKVSEDRKYAIDACIVRTMKSRKQLPHNQLISETIKQLRFPSKIADIKKRIGTLIEREYMARDEQDPNLYVYQT